MGYLITLHTLPSRALFLLFPFLRLLFPLILLLSFHLCVSTLRDSALGKPDRRHFVATVTSLSLWWFKGRFTHSMPCPCRVHAIPLPCRAHAANGLECVFPIWFIQCGRVWFTLAMPWPCHVPTMPFFSRPQHSTAVSRRPCCAVALRRTAWSEHGMVGTWHGYGMAWSWHGMVMAWQVWIRHGRTVQIKWERQHSKPLEARHGRGTAWTRHGHGMLCVNRP